MSWSKTGARSVAVGIVVLSAACSTGSAATGSVPSSPVSVPSSPVSAPGSAPPSVASTGPSGPVSSPFATEVNPPGDIPDSQAYVVYRVPGSRVTLKVPEGWSRSTATGTTTFADKLNSITVAVTTSATAPTVATVSQGAAATLGSRVPKYAAGRASTEQRTDGPVVRFTYTGDSAPDPVTSKVVRDAFEQYTYWRAGTMVVLTLAGPTNADNVDPWRKVTDSVRSA